MGIDPKTAFVRLFGDTARYHHRGRVFEDLITCASISVENSWLKCESLEKEYLEVIGRYERADVERFPQLFGMIIEGVSLKSDFLGSLFMELELGSTHMAQFFTPYEVSRLMAQIELVDVEKHFQDQDFITVAEPACGAGGMMIAVADVLQERGFNPQKAMWAHCTDVDALAARLCYLQLSLLGIPGAVVVGNALTLQQRRVMLTPMHHMGMWQYRLARRRSDAGMVEAPEAVSAVIEGLQTIRPSRPVGQMSMFDIVAPSGNTGT